MPISRSASLNSPYQAFLGTCLVPGLMEALILLLAYTGLRWSEAAALRVGMVDLDRPSVRVVVTFAEANGKLVEQTPKNGKFRTVPVPKSLIPELWPFIDGRSADALVFTTKWGASLRIRNWRNREFALAVKAAELDGLGLTPTSSAHLRVTGHCRRGGRRRSCRRYPATRPRP